MNRPKVLIIGSNGYIGKHLAKFLYEDGIQLSLYDVQPETLEPEMAPFYTSLDVLDKEALTKIDFDVDCVFLFFGLTGTSVGFKKYEEFITVNEVGLLNVLDRLKETQSNTRVIFPSSRLVYKGQKDHKLKEDDEKEFKTIYAINKFACENYLKIYHECFNIDHTIFRICVPYGNLLGDYSYGTMGFLLNRANQGQNIVLYGDGSQKRTFTHIYDICQILIKASFLKRTRNHVFNIGGDDFSLLQIANLVADKFGVKVAFSDWPALDLIIESGDTMFDSSKLNSLLNYQYKYDLVHWLSSKG